MLSLDLDVYETIILAVIYGFSQDGESTFAGSLNYLTQKARCSRRKVTMALPKLVKMGLISKIDKDVRGVHLCEYRVTPLCMMCMGSASDAPGGGACHAPNNIDNKNINITLSNKEQRKNFQIPSLEEVREYCMSRGNKVDPEQFFDFYSAKGWQIGKNPMKDWKACIRTWEKREKEVAPRKRETRTRKESVLEQNFRVIDEMYGTNLHDQWYKPTNKKMEDTIDEQ